MRHPPQGILHPGWSDSQHNLWQHTWHVAHKLSSNLTPQMLSPMANPARPLQQQQGLAGLPQVPGIIPGQQLPSQLMQQQQGVMQQQVPQHPVVDAAGVPLGVDGQLQQQVPQQAAH